MNSAQTIQTLRLHLLDMARRCQRVVDYALKAYSLGSTECRTIVRNNKPEINILHLQIEEITTEILSMEVSDTLDLRFVLSADRICNSLEEVHVHADDIATKSMRLLENPRRMRCKDLVSMGDVVNRLMRLCVVALFEENIDHAETVLRSEGVECEFETRFFESLNTLDRSDIAEAVYEISIGDSLSRMARELREVANAIMFWLSDSDHDWMPYNTEACMVWWESERLTPVR
jgi:phosphate uptake regulator